MTSSGFPYFTFCPRCLEINAISTYYKNFEELDIYNYLLQFHLSYHLFGGLDKQKIHSKIQVLEYVSATRS